MPEPQVPILQAQDLGKSYRVGSVTVDALRGITISIFRGEFVAIMGPSGSGKSTLLNVLSGLDQPTQGVVFLNGVPISLQREDQQLLLRRKELAFVFQSYDLLPLLNVQQNIEFPLALAGVPLPERQVRAYGLLEQMELAPKKDALPDELSGGQKQRVAIARALANDPQVLFADEPTGSLDSLTGGQVIALLRKTVTARGTTIVMVTHDEGDARQADRIIRLRDGRQVEEQT